MQDRLSNRDNERGVSTVEYVLLIAGMLVFAMASVQVLGSSIRGEFQDAQGALGTAEPPVTLAFDESGDPGPCPTGWNLIPATLTKKNQQSVDRNGDGLICRKNIPGGGNGNTNQNQNVKDNNK
ncbi:MAG: Flp family type IVb pilin [Acidimicrobiales bacterium]